MDGFSGSMIVDTAADGKEGLQKAIDTNPDIIICDVMMPEMNGLELCKRIKENQNYCHIPVILLTAKSMISQIEEGLDAGADDYIVKPFSPKELMARINAVLSRFKAASHSNQTTLKFDGLEINIPARTVSVDGKKVELTPKEYDLLFYLVENKNIALSRDKLLSDIWGYDFFGDDRTIDTHIKNLRNSLGPYRDYIVTLRGVGYKFEYED